MKIEAGKFYRTRDGRKVGPIERGHYPTPSRYWQAPGGAITAPSGRGLLQYWTDDGQYWPRESPNWSEDSAAVDLVAEWSDGPVREVITTRREVVPGVYGRLEVVDSDQDRVHLRLAAKGGITLASNSTHVLSRDELDQLITNLTALRDVL